MSYFFLLAFDSKEVTLNNDMTTKAIKAVSKQLFFELLCFIIMAIVCVMT